MGQAEAQIVSNVCYKKTLSSHKDLKNRQKQAACTDTVYKTNGLYQHFELYIIEVKLKEDTRLSKV